MTWKGTGTFSFADPACLRIDLHTVADPPVPEGRSMEEPSGVSQLRALEKLLIAKDKEIGEQKREIAELRVQLNEFTDQEAELKQLRSQLRSASTERETLQAELYALKGRDEALQRELAKVQKDLPGSDAGTPESMIRSLRFQFQALQQAQASQEVKNKDKDLEVRRLRIELGEQRELCRQVTKELEEMQEICSERFACSDQKADYLRLIESLRVENSLADTRIQSLETANRRLRLDLQSCMSTSPACVVETPTHVVVNCEIPVEVSSPLPTRRYYYPRRPHSVVGTVTCCSPSLRIR